MLIIASIPLLKSLLDLASNRTFLAVRRVLVWISIFLSIITVSTSLEPLNDISNMFLASIASFQIISMYYAERIYLWLLKFLVNRIDNPEGVLEAVEQRYFKHKLEFTSEKELSTWLRNHPDHRVIPRSPLSAENLHTASIVEVENSEESGYLKKEYLLYGLVALTVLALFYYRNEIGNYFSPSEPDAPKTVRLDGKEYVERVVTKPIDVTEKNWLGRTLYRIKTIFFGESYESHTILESKRVLNFENYATLSLQSKVRLLNLNYSERNLETLKKIIMTDHDYDEEDFERLRSLFIGPGLIFSDNKWTEYIDISPRSQNLTTLDRINLDRESYFPEPGPSEGMLFKESERKILRRVQSLDTGLANTERATNTVINSEEVIKKSPFLGASGSSSAPNTLLPSAELRTSKVVEITSDKYIPYSEFNTKDHLERLRMINDHPTPNNINAFMTSCHESWGLTEGDIMYRPDAAVKIIYSPVALEKIYLSGGRLVPPTPLPEPRLTIKDFPKPEEYGTATILSQTTSATPVDFEGKNLSQFVKAINSGSTSIDTKSLRFYCNAYLGLSDSEFKVTYGKGHQPAIELSLPATRDPDKILFKTDNMNVFFKDPGAERSIGGSYFYPRSS